MARVLLYTRFLRLWHWLQALLVLVLLITGFEVHGTYTLFGYEQSSGWHRLAAWTLIGLWILAWFWHLTTGEWKQYIPSPAGRLWAMLRYYGIGIFKGEPHPFHRDRWHRHNPLQRLVYLSVHLMIGPLLWLSGLLYITYALWPAIGLGGLPLGLIAAAHTAGAFLMTAFMIVHVYLALTTAELPLGNLKAMITGYEERSPT